MEYPLSFELLHFFTAFETFAEEPEVRVVVSSARKLRGLRTLAGSRWQVRTIEGRTLVEVTHPPTGRLFCRAEVGKEYRRWIVRFEEETICALSRDDAPIVNVSLPHPLDQLLWILPLARIGGVFQHACAAVVDGRAFVFLGHSGDGKTTLARRLQQEGIPILSDERVALRPDGGGYRVYGTPWAGEGAMASSDSRPLSALLLLRKGDHHRVQEDRRHTLAGEMIARSIVPYYVPDAAESVLTSLSDLASRFPVYWLDVALRPGLLSVLREEV